MNEDDDGLRAARGCMNGAIGGLLIWIGLGLLVWLFLG
jgi:hypothetical protein